MSAESAQMDMLHGPLFGKICAFAIPLAVTSVFQQLFNSADSAIAGRFIGNDALAGVGAVSPIVSLLVGLFVGLSIGTNVAIANSIGSGKTSSIPALVHTSVALALASGTALLVAGLFLAGPLVALIRTPAEVSGVAAAYLRAYFIGMPFEMLYNFGSAVLRAKGDSVRPLIALVAGCAVNLALDLFFVAVVPLGVFGIGLATAVAYVAAGGLILRALMREDEPFRLRLRRLSIDRASLSFILKIGMPAGLQTALFAVSNLIIQAAINGFGAEAMAGSAATLNYESYTYLLLNGFGSACVTFTGQNYAARQYGRCRQVFWICMAGSLLSSAALSALFVLNGRFFLGIFTSDAEALRYGMIRMWYVELFVGVEATFEVPGGALRGMGYSLTPAVIVMLGTCVFRVIWILTVFQHFHTFEMLLIVYLVSWVLAGTGVLVAYAVIGHAALSGDKGTHAYQNA